MSKYTALYKLPLPPSPELAKEHGEARYWSNKPCIHCKNDTPIRYVENDACFGCAQREFKQGLWYALNDPTNLDDIPTTPAEAHEMGLTYYFTGNACRNAPHAEKKSIISGRCLNCGGESPRQEAIKAGEAYYTPETPCPKCNTYAQRAVSNGRCLGCSPAKGNKGGKPAHEPTAVLMRDCPDIVLGREEARNMGFKVFRTGTKCNRGHTGFRYVSTGGCLECKKS